MFTSPSRPKRHSRRARSAFTRLIRATSVCAPWLALTLQSDPTPAQTVDADEWREDLAVLARELPRRHVAPTVERSLEEFAADVERLTQRIPSLSREQIVVELARLAASFGDSHTELSLAQDRAGFHRVPLGLYFFGSDLRVVAVDPDHEGLLGWRLVAIETHPIRDVLDRVQSIIADDFGNPHELLHSGPAFVAIPEVLIALGFAEPARPIRYVLENDEGERVDASFASLSFQAAAAAMTSRLLSPEEGPLFTRRREHWYHFERVDSSDVLYVRVSRSQDQDRRESLSRFARQVTDAIRTGGVKRVVVDLRQNTGGNFNRTEPLVRALCGAVTEGTLSQVYVILGRHTYSAAIVLAGQLEQGCDALFVGEVPRAVPNRQADVRSFRLPNSGLEITYGAKLHRPFPTLGDATTIPLDLPAPWTWESYREGRDPALERILRPESR